MDAPVGARGPSVAWTSAYLSPCAAGEARGGGGAAGHVRLAAGGGRGDAAAAHALGVPGVGDRCRGDLSFYRIFFAAGENFFLPKVDLAVHPIQGRPF